MSNSPVRVKRAILPHPASKGARVTVVESPPQSARSLPNVDTDAPKAVGVIQGHGLAAALGVRKSEPKSTIKFERAPAANLLAMGLGVSRKAPSIVIAYGRADDSATAIEAFANEGAHEYRREGAQGRNVLRAVLASLSKGDTLMVARLADIASPKDLPRIVAEVEKAGVHIVALDGGADTRTPQGRGKLANQIVTAKALFGLRL
jgi:hypothetical protein